MTIGEVLKQKRQEERLSLRQAALRIGVSPQAYTWWEKDQIVPEGRWAAALASWLGRSQVEVLKMLGVLTDDLIEEIRRPSTPRKRGTATAETKLGSGRGALVSTAILASEVRAA